MATETTTVHKLISEMPREIFQTPATAFMKLLILEYATLVYTPGNFALAQPTPQETRPIKRLSRTNGPPLSPMEEKR